MSVKRNFMFSSILTVSNYIFPFIVYPYVARVLGPANIGICNFVDSIVNYAMLLSLMGISIVGVRSIAKAKGDKQKLNQAFTALFVICAAFTVVATAALVGVAYLVDELREYRSLLMIGIIKLWGNFLLIDWLYKGLEDFRYITMRTIAVKVAFLVSVFALIHVASDYTIYFLLLCLMVAVNAAFNCYRASTIVKFSFSMQAVKAAIVPLCILGAYLLLSSMYTTFNVTYLGFACGDEQVGYYTTATKIFKILLALYTAYSTVVLPRASALLSEGKKQEFMSLIERSIHGLILFSVPVAIYCIIYSQGIINLIAGEAYGGAVLPMQIVMPMIFIIGYEQIMVVQVLMPMATDRVILINSLIGSIIGIGGNILLVGHLASVGSAIVWICAELAVLVASQIYVTRHTGLRFPFKALAKDVAAYVPFILLSVGILCIPRLTAVQQMLVGAAALCVYAYLVQRFVLGNPVFVEQHERLMRGKGDRDKR